VLGEAATARYMQRGYYSSTAELISNYGKAAHLSLILPLTGVGTVLVNVQLTGQGSDRNQSHPRCGLTSS
jgi:hypothetical protein